MSQSERALQPVPASPPLPPCKGPLACCPLDSDKERIEALVADIRALMALGDGAPAPAPPLFSPNVPPSTPPLNARPPPPSAARRQHVGRTSAPSLLTPAPRGPAPAAACGRRRRPRAPNPHRRGEDGFRRAAGGKQKAMCLDVMFSYGRPRSPMRGGGGGGGAVCGAKAAAEAAAAAEGSCTRGQGGQHE